MSDETPEQQLADELADLGDGPALDSGPPIVALEPATEPVHPLRATDVAALLPKEIG